MTKLKSVQWNGGSSAHAAARPSRQRELVEASLLRRGGSTRNWDESTRTEHVHPAS